MKVPAGEIRAKFTPGKKGWQYKCRINGRTLIFIPDGMSELQPSDKQREFMIRPSRVHHVPQSKKDKTKHVALLVILTRAL